MNASAGVSVPLPVAIVGAGPVGLAAAAHLSVRGLPFVVLEAGDRVGAAMLAWGHVRLFSPWRYNIDTTARRLLTDAGWTAPADDALPTGREIVEDYLDPLSRLDGIRPHLRLGARVSAVGRKDYDKVRTAGREDQPFELRLAGGASLEARAVIDASGTWWSPNLVGAGGLPAIGEAEAAPRIAYGIPDVFGRQRSRYAGRHVMVVGSGHSAMNVMLDLLALQDQAPATRVTWAVRRASLASVFGGEDADALPARGALGARVRAAVEAGRLEVLMPFRIRSIAAAGVSLSVLGTVGDEERAVSVDEIVGATGFRPDLGMLRELRLATDSWLEAPVDLAPLIDPNLHSCGTVRPHGALELRHPEKDFFIAGMKSYGRAPTFLLATGYEQIRSIAAWLAGDIDAARQVDLQLPETGVCGAPAALNGGEGCCGPAERPAPVEPVADDCCGGRPQAGVDACCVRDAEAKAAGEAGCGCSGTAAAVPAARQRACCG